LAKGQKVDEMIGHHLEKRSKQTELFSSVAAMIDSVRVDKF
jgi:hypothetical protein